MATPWQPVTIDGNPFYFELGAVGAFIDYAVADSAGKPVKQGQLQITYVPGIYPIVIDEADATRKDDDDPYSPENNPVLAFSKVNFRCYPCPEGLMLQYRSNHPLLLVFRFKVSIAYHVPGPYRISAIPSFISRAPLMFSPDILGETSGPAVMTIVNPLLMKIGGVDNLHVEMPAPDTTVDTYPRDMKELNFTASDSTGSVYVVGSSDGTGPNCVILAKYTHTGVFLWQRCLALDTGINYYTTYFNLAIDSSDNVYAVGQVSRASTGDPYNGFDSIISKYSSNGTPIFERVYSANNNEYSYFSALVVTSTACYVTGAETTTGGSGKYWGPLLLKINQTNGDIIWANHGGSSYSLGILTLNIFVNSQGDIIQTGYTGQGAQYLRKFTSTGTVLWTRVQESASAYWYEPFFTLGDDDSIYVAESFNTDSTGSPNAIMLTKYNNSDGSVAWQRRTGYARPTGGQEYDFGLCSTCVTASGIHVTTTLKTIAANYVVIIDYDLTGHYIRSRFIQSSSREPETFWFNTMTALHDYFYISVASYTTYFDSRSLALASMVIPITWDGIEMNFGDDLRMFLPVANSTLEFSTIDNDTTSSVTTITNPATTFSLSADITTPNVVYAPSIPLYPVNQVVSNLAVQTVAKADSFLVDPNASSGGNYWAIRQVSNITDLTVDNITINTFGSAVDQDNIYSFGVNNTTGVYAPTIEWFWISMTDSSGNLKWLIKLNAPDMGNGYGHITVDDTAIYLVTNDQSTNGLNVIAIALNGNLAPTTILWNKRLAVTLRLDALNIIAKNSKLYMLVSETIGSQGYLLVFNRTTGAITTSHNYTGYGTAPNPSSFVFDQTGTYYYVLSQPLGFSTFIGLSKHLTTTGAVQWQHNISVAQASSYRIDLFVNGLVLDSDNNIIICAFLQDHVVSAGNTFPTRQVLMKYDSTGALLLSKQYRVTTTLDKTVTFAIKSNNPMSNTIWAGDRLISYLSVDKHGGSRAWVVDSFDKNLVPIWGRIIDQAGFGYINYLGNISKGSDAAYLSIMIIRDNSLNYLLKLPYDGVFELNGFGLFLHDLTYENRSDHALLEDTGTYYISSVTTTTSITSTTVSSASFGTVTEIITTKKSI